MIRAISAATAHRYHLSETESTSAFFQAREKIRRYINYVRSVEASAHDASYANYLTDFDWLSRFPRSIPFQGDSANLIPPIPPDLFLILCKIMDDPVIIIQL